MIEKVIHYCWFGKNPLPKSAIKCINSWKKFLPGYKIVEWNESNFDINLCKYTKQAHDCKQWAFVSDVARFWILYNFGGVYFDTDVELVKPIDDILSKGPFMGIELESSSTSQFLVAPGLGMAANPGLGMAANPGLGMAANPGLGIYKEVLDYYYSANFLDQNGNIIPHTVCTIVTSILVKHGLRFINDLQLIDEIYIYPSSYFCPLDYKTKQLVITDDTRSIHWYSASWFSKKQRLVSFIRFALLKILGKSLYYYLLNLYKSKFRKL